MAFLIPTITRARWLTVNTLRVEFTSPLNGYAYQLYAGRSLVGVSESTAARTIDAQLTPYDLPQHLQVVAITNAERGTDFGPQLPPRPYNRVRLNWDASGFEADAKHFRITAGTAPGGAVDDNNEIGQVPFDGNGEFEFETEPLETGTWNFEIQAFDDKPSQGNSGTAASVAADVGSYPADVGFDEDGNRLTVTTDGTTATIDWGNS